MKSHTTSPSAKISLTGSAALTALVVTAAAPAWAQSQSDEVVVTFDQVWVDDPEDISAASEEQVGADGDSASPEGEAVEFVSESSSVTSVEDVVEVGATASEDVTVATEAPIGAEDDAVRAVSTVTFESEQSQQLEMSKISEADRTAQGGAGFEDGDGGAATISQSVEQANLLEQRVEPAAPEAAVTSGDAVAVGAHDITAGRNGLMAQSGVALGFGQEQTREMSNIVELDDDATGGAGGAGGAADIKTSTSQVNAAEQDSQLVLSASGEARATNTAVITAGRMGAQAARSALTLEHAQSQTLSQSNTVVQAAAGAGASSALEEGEAGGAASDVGKATQLNAAEQDVALGNIRTDGAEASNTGSIAAQDDSLIASTALVVDVAQTQDLEQEAIVVQDATVMGGAGGSNGGVASIEQSGQQDNVARQNASLGTMASGAVAVHNSGAVSAGGRGLVARSDAQLSFAQSQRVEQSAILVQQADATAGQAGEDMFLMFESAREGGAAQVRQDAQQSVLAEQTAVIGDVSAGPVLVENTGAIESGGHGIEASSQVRARITQSQMVQQERIVVQEASATGGAGISGGAGGDAAVVQTAEVGLDNTQSLEVGTISAGDVTVRNSADIRAGGHAILAASQVDLELEVAHDLDREGVAVVQQGAAQGGAGSPLDSDMEGEETLAQDAQEDDSIDVAPAPSVATRAGKIVIETSGDLLGGEDYAGVAIVGGADNALINSGRIASLSGHAVAAGAGNDRLENFGVIDGNITLGEGTNSLINHAGGRLNTGPRIQIGTGAALENFGILSPGGDGVIARSEIEGDFIQAESGRWHVDVDADTGEVDQLALTGRATLDGAVVPNFLGLPGDGEMVIGRANAGFADAGIFAQDALLVDNDLSFTDAGEVILNTQVNMAAPSADLNDDQRALGAHLDAFLTAQGPGELAPIYEGLFALDDVDALAAAYDQMGPEIHLDTAMSAMVGAMRFSSDLLSCSTFQGARVSLQEGQCAWARGYGREMSISADDERLGFDQNGTGVSLGAQHRLWGNFHGGVGLGYEDLSMANDAGARAEAERLSAGVSLKYSDGPFAVAGVISGARSGEETTREVLLPGYEGEVEGEYDLWSINATLRASYLVNTTYGYLKPRVDLSYTRSGHDAFTEEGGPAALRVASATHETFSLAPAVEWGTQIEMEGHVVRPYASAGVTFLSSPGVDLGARFDAASVDGFTNASSLERTTADIGLGVELFSSNGLTVRGDYSGKFGSDTDAHAFGLKASIAF